MNIPLNIDWQQILLHLLNFLVLLAGLYLLLYKPVKDFMDKRRQHFIHLENEANQKLEQAEELKISYQHNLDSVQHEIEEKKTKAEKEAQASAAVFIKDAKKQAEIMISDAKKEASQERAKILEETQKDIASMAISATEKLLARSTSGSLDQFLDAMNKR